jgi:hypothetical protein
VLDDVDLARRVTNVLVAAPEHVLIVSRPGENRSHRVASRCPIVGGQLASRTYPLRLPLEPNDRRGWRAHAVREPATSKAVRRAGEAWTLPVRAA